MMSALREGDVGDRVVELHQRLNDLGFVAHDLHDRFGAHTVAVVEAFQRSKGLRITGDVDELTWSRLVEAGWRLGQRLLYLVSPHIRGDDVAELQVRLAQLGFNPGHIDGIFGVQTDEALRDFQRNCGVDSTGVLTRATLLELQRLTSRDGDRRLVTEARDVAGFDLPDGPVVLCGDPMIVLPLRDALTDAGTSVVVSDDYEGTPALANGADASVVLSLVPLSTSGLHLHYWVGYHSHSRRGQQLASRIATAFSASELLPRVEVTGMGLEILRETRMPTLHVELHVPSDEVLHEIVTTIARVLAEVIHK